jgi:hypothetical protein
VISHTFIFTYFGKYLARLAYFNKKQRRYQPKIMAIPAKKQKNTRKNIVIQIKCSNFAATENNK